MSSTSGAWTSAAFRSNPDGSLRIGASVTNSDLAHHPLVKQRYAALSQAILAGASTQLRNAATTAGNLLQRTRCVYFRNTATPCNKREPGSGCPAITGANRMMAILGTSEACIASNPSDMAVAMLAYDATVHVEGVAGTRSIALKDFFLLPQDRPDVENRARAGDLITHITLPSPGRRASTRSTSSCAIAFPTSLPWFLRLQPPSYPMARSPASASRLAASEPDPGATSTRKPR